MNQLNCSVPAAPEGRARPWWTVFVQELWLILLVPTLHLAEVRPDILLPQTVIQSLRLRLQDGGDWTVCDGSQGLGEILSQREEPLAVPGGLLDELLPLLLLHSQ